MTSVSTTIVEDDVDPVLDMAEGDGSEDMVDWRLLHLRLSSLELDPLRSVRLICLLLAPSWVYEGLLALTIFPSASLHSLFLVAKTPRPSPPASSSFSL